MRLLAFRLPLDLDRVSHVPSGMNLYTLINELYSYWAKPEHCLDLSQYLNNHVAQCVEENPKRFVGTQICH